MMWSIFSQLIAGWAFSHGSLTAQDEEPVLVYEKSSGASWREIMAVPQIQSWQINKKGDAALLHVATAETVSQGRVVFLALAHHLGVMEISGQSPSMLSVPFHLAEWARFLVARCSRSVLTVP